MSTQTRETIVAGAIGMALFGCGADDVLPPVEDAAACSRFVSEVLTSDFGSGQAFGQSEMPEVVYGPPRGGGCCTGSMDVVSLGNGGQIVVGFGAGRIVDGPGADLVVFENAFESGPNVFAELASVEVSADGEQWVGYLCDATEAPYDSCAGISPVYLDGDDGPFDVATAGGDAFDLADVGLAEARYVRITDRGDLGGLAGVFDLDAVGIVNLECR